MRDLLGRPQHHRSPVAVAFGKALSLSVKLSTETGLLQACTLGVRREGVTEAAGRLLRLGVIEYTRGQITVLDRPQLEKLSCECYAVVKKESERLVSTHHGL